MQRLANTDAEIYKITNNVKL